MLAARSRLLHAASPTSSRPPCVDETCRTRAIEGVVVVDCMSQPTSITRDRCPFSTPLHTLTGRIDVRRSRHWGGRRPWLESEGCSVELRYVTSAINISKSVLTIRRAARRHRARCTHPSSIPPLQHPPAIQPFSCHRDVSKSRNRVRSRRQRLVAASPILDSHSSLPLLHALTGRIESARMRCHCRRPGTAHVHPTISRPSSPLLHASTQRIERGRATSCSLPAVHLLRRCRACRRCCQLPAPSQTQRLPSPNTTSLDVDGTFPCCRRRASELPKSLACAIRHSKLLDNTTCILPLSSNSRASEQICATSTSQRGYAWWMRSM